MKKNKLFVLGLVTVFVALVSLTLVSSTWAKYTSTASGSDTARVAYWGFEQGEMTTDVETVIDDLFVDMYDSNEHKTVESNDDTGVIAPGTKNSRVVEVRHNSTAPEVAYQVSYNLSIQGALVAALNANQNFYWTLTYNGSSGTYQNAADLEAAVNSIVTTHAPNETYTGTFEFGWVWTYSANAAGDAADTTMGNNALLANNDVTVTLTATATQID